MADYFTGYQNALPQTSLADMMNLASSAQQYKQAQAVNPLELQIKQLAAQQAQALNPIAQQKAQLELDQLARTYPDLADKIASEAALAKTQANVAAQTAPSAISKAASEAKTAEAGARGAVLDASVKFASQTAPIALQLLNLPDSELTSEKVKSSLKSQMKLLPGITDEDVNMVLGRVPNLNGAALRPHIIDFMRGTNEQLISALNSKYPAPTNINVGNAILPVTAGNQALTGQMAGQPVGFGVKTEVPPTQEYVEENTGKKYIVDAKGQKQYTGIGPAAEAAQTAFGTTSGADWNTTVTEANDASRTRPLYDTIRGVLPLAFTGVGSDKKQFMSKVAQAIGIPLNTLETTNTEELIKNSKLLQAVGGNTDAARSIAELANPSANMTLAGNQKVINQLEGQAIFKEEKAHFLAPYAGKADYQNRLREWNGAADALFFTEMTKEDAAQIMQTMSEKRRAELLKKRERAKALGIIP